MAEEYEGEVVFVGVSNNDTVEDGEVYRQEFDVPYTLAHAPEVWEQFGDPARPSTIVFDRGGRIATEITGPVTYEGLKEELEKVVAR